jgi:FMN-dependent oxidoreductase (nitrilotriacetate monooxygenase family)
MTNPRRQMHLGLFWLGTGNHAAGWRWEGADASNCDWEILARGARTAERAKLDLFFISDGLSTKPVGDHPSFMTRLEPTTMISALSAITRHIGLGATASTSFNEPYNIARVFQSVQHISAGRAAWNIVTTSGEAAAANFSRDHLHGHDKRYEIAEEFVDVVRGLWGTWQPGAVIADKQTGEYVDAGRVQPLGYKGKHFQVKGPLNIEQSPHGNPLLIQAGGSESGQELSARTADIVFSVVNGDKVSAKAAYDGLKARLPKHGRQPHQMAILPGVMPIVGRSDQEAKETLSRLQSWLSPTNAMQLVSMRIGHDISGYPLDGPVPELPLTQGGQGFSRALLDMARREKMTLRDLYNITAAARGHWVITGTPKRIADTLEEWFTEGLADGFVLMPAWFPGAFDEFNDQVIPELQRRGLFRKEYTGPTLRHHLGLAKPA